MIYVLVNDNVITLKVAKPSDNLGIMTVAAAHEVGAADIGLAHHVRKVLVSHMESSDVRTPMDERLEIIDVALIPYKRAMARIDTDKGKTLISPSVVALARSNMRAGDIAVILDTLVDYANLRCNPVESAEGPVLDEKEDNVDELVRVSY